jgi:hypothetical protein
MTKHGLCHVGYPRDRHSECFDCDRRNYEPRLLESRTVRGVLEWRSSGKSERPSASRPGSPVSSNRSWRHQSIRCRAGGLAHVLRVTDVTAGRGNAARVAYSSQTNVSDRLHWAHLNREKSGLFALASCSTSTIGRPQYGQSGDSTVARALMALILALPANVRRAGWLRHEPVSPL